MKVCVYGLWHLGCVTAACLAEAGHHVMGLDPDERVISDLHRATPPLFEPGLGELTLEGIQAARLMFTTDSEEAISQAEVVWVTFDTPVDADDRADVGYVLERVRAIFPLLMEGAVVLISSQLPVGSARQLEQAYAAGEYAPNVRFAVSPENLRLGKALSVFRTPDRVVIGVRNESDRATLTALFAPITDRIEWMGVESAEMTKHALNGFLALSVTYANEIAALCEQVGADAKEVERGLKSEARIGQAAYLGPGAAFSGGTLARDITFMGDLATQHGLVLPVVSGVPQSNNTHRGWAIRRLRELLGADLTGKRIALLGLTYKPGTDTLRRSLAIELAQGLHAAGCVVVGHDPAVKALPPELGDTLTLADTFSDALRGADAAILSTQWEAYKELTAQDFAAVPILLDANGYLRATLGNVAGLQYLAVGQG
jgi:UDPglucose 6-dehydrogenase